ncbi:Dephospho-CoA kinase [Hondaea fermentalgiana]|uniref:Dephospho-CoA kinase n=1 Tax=Hondaea fermentalgiana TaxID=2315210 RepID=A0A2R5G0I7_9STRA|nr:Dephospho-CoA kinase [Hondaea fermentalgiana]|eukprot:GBG24546.1 Dephospho-CoA kinase [Hondaea fermentalgiana]
MSSPPQHASTRRQRCSILSLLITFSLFIEIIIVVVIVVVITIIIIVVVVVVVVVVVIAIIIIIVVVFVIIVIIVVVVVVVVITIFVVIVIFAFFFLIFVVASFIVVNDVIVDVMIIVVVIIIIVAVAVALIVTGIACGKSTVTAELEKRGIPVVDCDKLSRKVVEPGHAVFDKIVKKHGEDILLPDKSGLDRQKLGDIVFKDAEKRRELTAMVGPAIFMEITKALLYNFAVGTSLVVIDAPTLYETEHLLYLVSEVIVVAASQETQVKRIKERDGLTEEQAMDRIKAQMPVEEKVKRADIVIRNDDSLESFQKQANEVIEQIEAKYKYSLFVLWSLPGIALIASIIVGAQFLRR